MAAKEKTRGKPDLTEDELHRLALHTQGLRTQEDLFMASDAASSLRLRLEEDQPLRAAAQAAYAGIAEEISARGVKEKAASYNVHLEMAVARDRLMLELADCGDIDMAAQRTRDRLDRDKLLEAASQAPIPAEDDLSAE